MAKDSNTAKKSNTDEAADRAPQADAAPSPEPEHVARDVLAPEPKPDEPQAALGAGDWPERQRDIAPREPSPRERAEFAARDDEWRVRETALKFGRAILSNPQATQMLYGNPLEAARKCQEAPSVGAYLARSVMILAEDFMAEVAERSEAYYMRRLAEKLGELTG